MIAIKPVSDLRNYNEVLQDVADESPVFLTKNGRGSYAVITIKDYERLTATKTLFAELKNNTKIIFIFWKAFYSYPCFPFINCRKEPICLSDRFFLISFQRIR